jgi:histidinol-phosphate/aromatic aminotransferase/cobyric acid decarboxylase-like protein
MQQQAHGGNLVWAAALAGCPPSAIVDFSASISPLGPPDSVLAAIGSQLGTIRNYPDPDCSDLRIALSHFHQLPSDWILPGNGSAELLSLVGRELAQLAATVLITPAFGDYYRALAAYDAKVLELSVVSGQLSGVSGQWSGVSGQGSVVSGRGSVVSGQGSVVSGQGSVVINDLSSIIDKGQLTTDKGLLTTDKGLLTTDKGLLTTDKGQLTTDKGLLTTDKGIIFNNPHNPTGRLFRRDEILPYLEKFALVVVDEAFMDFLPPDEEQSLIEYVQDYPNLVILRSLTKFYSLPGLRLGYALAHPDRLQRWRAWRDPWTVNTLAMVAGVAALADKAFQAKTWEWLPDARNQLFEGLSQIPGLQPLPGSANFLLVQSEHSCVELQQRLLKQHQILIRDCRSFPELGDRFFRVAVKTPQDNERLLKALMRE